MFLYIYFNISKNVFKCNKEEGNKKNDLITLIRIIHMITQELSYNHIK